ncbi:OmpA family protein [Spirosoma sp. BT702]|uniref:OmpA family protein n=1 Tax=Spirosoma profusum TaxID=2771354 RepID=A0A926XU12_9BACT|nr:OmpA family protein [Spirosoma profusum]MBD2700399.1 OmpA family protein [Spirosoma profusum]
MLRKAIIISLIYSLSVACNNESNQSQEKTTEATTSATSSESASVQDTAAQTETVRTDSGQNYAFTSSGDSLQIVGNENQYDIILPTDVLFDFDKSNLRPDGIALLTKVKQHFAEHGADQLHVLGHTDSKGSDQYNAVLSQKRAVAVADWLKKQIKVKGLIMSIGKGEKEPLVPNTNSDGSDNPVNRQKNRRVTLSVVNYPDAGKMLKDAKANAGKNS